MEQYILKTIWSKTWLKNIIVFIGGLTLFVAISCGIAWLINCLILQPSDLKFIDAENKTGALWLGFWATFLSAIASFAMVFITWLSLRQMQRQWEEQNRPYLVFDIVVVDNFFLLQVENVGRSIARNINVRLDDKFCLILKEHNGFITLFESNSIEKTLFDLGVNKSRYYTLFSWTEEMAKEVIFATIGISGTYSSIYKIETKLQMSYYFDMAAQILNNNKNNGTR